MPKAGITQRVFLHPAICSALACVLGTTIGLLAGVLYTALAILTR